MINNFPGLPVILFHFLLIGRLIFLLARKESVSENNSPKLKSWIFYFSALAFFLFSALFLYVLVSALGDRYGLAMLAPFALIPTLFVSGLCFFLLFFIYKKSKKVAYVDHGAIVIYSLLLYFYTLSLALRFF